ncbi:MAG: 2-oxo acid dehydrogenase, partial [Proteobacteria bacterium]|nr:2-oxo acid dehydrogenase [Pseudomonadota bacterium]
MPHLDLELKSKMSSFRRIAIGTWKTTYDPSIYGAMTVKMDDLIRYMNEFNQKTGRHITITHIMAKAVASTLEQMPDANAILRFNRIYVRKSIGVFFQVALTDDETGELDLSGATIHDANQKSLVEIHDEFSEQVKKVR